MKAFIDKKECVGCGLCESMCPGLFEMRGNVAIVSHAVLPEDSEACAEDMENVCPVKAIKIIQ